MTQRRSGVNNLSRRCGNVTGFGLIAGHFLIAIVIDYFSLGKKSSPSSGVSAFGADLRVGDATSLPWPDGTFRLVVCSTVFTSILDPLMRRQIASEITRVLVRGGAMLWYDFRINNPKNKNVQKVNRSDLSRLFPELKGALTSVTLAPPLTRLLAPRTWVLASVLESVPALRTHLLGVLLKVSSSQTAS